MAGLRNSGVDTSTWYLAGFSGTELPGQYDPETLFGGTLPNFGLLDVDFRNPNANVTMQFQHLREQPGSPPVHYFVRGDGGLLAVDADTSTPRPFELPSYTSAGVRDGIWHTGDYQITGLSRAPLDDSSWVSVGVVDSHVGGGDYSAVPGAWTGYTNITAIAGNTDHSVGDITGLSVAAGRTAGVQIVVRRVGSAAQQMRMTLIDNAITADRLEVYFNFDAKTIHEAPGGTAVITYSAFQELSPGTFFVQMYGRFPSGAVAGTTARVGIGEGNAGTFNATGAESIDVDWYGLVLPGGTTGPMPWLTLGTLFNGGPITASDGLQWTNTAVNIAGPEGFTFLADFDPPEVYFAADSSIRQTPLRFVSTGSHSVRIAHRQSTQSFFAEFLNNSVLQAQIEWTPTPGQRQRCAFRVNGNDFSLHVNGALVGTDVSGTVPASLSFTSGGQTVISGSVTPLLKLRRCTLAPLVDQATALVYSSGGW